MAMVQVYTAYEFRCAGCSHVQQSTSKASLVNQAASHVILDHLHPHDDRCGCALVTAANKPEQIVWAYRETSGWQS